MLARAFPDRVAQHAGARGRFRLANGRAAALERSDALAREPFLVVTDITGTAATGKIRAAAAISRDDIEDAVRRPASRLKRRSITTVPPNPSAPAVAVSSTR